jgi:hypothetical protein
MRMQRPLILGWLFLASSFVVLGQDKETPKKERTPAELKALERIRQLGGLALELAQSDPRLEVSFQQVDGKLTDEHFLLLKDLKDLVYLNLRGKEVTDAQLAHLAGLTSLMRLHLERTKITDQGTPALKGLVNLEYLNLYGTDIGDASLINLERMNKLKHLYLWQTKVTDGGVARLQKALPQLDIVRGLDLSKVEEKKPEPKDAKMTDKKGKTEKADKGKDDKKGKDEKKADPKAKDDKNVDPKGKDDKKADTKPDTKGKDEKKGSDDKKADAKGKEDKKADTKDDKKGKDDKKADK